jgi:quinolinate synthase
MPSLQAAPPACDLQPYKSLANIELTARIQAVRKQFGSQLLILGHHYQQDEVIALADLRGDSYGLSQHAAESRDCRYIVFCGVHFMAETADILANRPQKLAERGGERVPVILPDLAAGCSMADMAAIDQLEVCWQELEMLGAASVIPVTYINSTAAIKGFCGSHGGIVCTSSNAAKVMQWAWTRGEKLLMLPDQHLGRNTAYRIGVPLDEMAIWDPDVPFGGLDETALRRARLILWKGHCGVHTRFTVRQIDQFRRANPAGRVIVHPECTFEVVQAADECGSTEQIIRAVKDSPEGSVWAVGTEIHLVSRLAREVAPSRTVVTLDSLGCLCSTMFRISPNHLLWALEGLVDGEVHNHITVPEPTKTWAKVALDRMLTVT